MRTLLVAFLCITVALCWPRRGGPWQNRHYHGEDFEKDMAYRRPYNMMNYNNDEDFDRPHHGGYGFRPPSYNYNRLPAFLTWQHEDNTQPPLPPPPPRRPVLPSKPMNPVLSTLSELPLSLYNNYICNMFGSQEVSPNINADLVRHKRGLFSNDYFKMIRDFRRVVKKTYSTLKPFLRSSSKDLYTKIQNAALNAMQNAGEHGLQLKDVAKAVLAETLKSDGLVGDINKIFDAIVKLVKANRLAIKESTQEAVDKSCGIVNNHFYCTYMSKLAKNAECSSQYFSTEILDKCCSGLLHTTTKPTEVPVVASTSAPILALTDPPTASDPVLTNPPVVQSTPALTEVTTNPPVVATTAATTTTTIVTTTTISPQACGISTVNAATRFADFSSAMNQVRIVGGVDTEKCEYPWIVRLQVGNSLCGGTIIDDTHILTAGHCIGTNTASDITVHAGEYDYNIQDTADVAHAVATINVHPNYTESTTSGVENDAAVLTLKEPLTFNDCVQPVCLPNPGDGAAIEPATQCVVAGWGTTSSGGQTANILQEVTVPTYSGEDCATGLFSQTIPTDPSLQICAGRPVIGGADSCQGDAEGPMFCYENSRYVHYDIHKVLVLQIASGDPLFCPGDSGGPLFCPVDGKYVQYGIVSYGSGCADAGAAGVYADASAMMDFINSVTQ